MDSSTSQKNSVLSSTRYEAKLVGKIFIPKVVYEEVTVASPATRDSLGLIIVGDHLNITEDGVLSVDTESLGSNVISSDEINKIAILPDGTMEVNSVDVNKIVNSEATNIILFGGNA